MSDTPEPRTYRWFVMEGPLNAPWIDGEDGEKRIEVVPAVSLDAAVEERDRLKQELRESSETHAMEGYKEA